MSKVRGNHICDAMLQTCGIVPYRCAIQTSITVTKNSDSRNLTSAVLVNALPERAAPIPAIHIALEILGFL